MGNRIAKRVLLIGWDAADWKMIRPLIDQGKMPTLAGLLAGGVSGNLATIRPVLSPMLWNSIATGKRADKHGIAGFVEPKRDRSGIRPVSSTSRTCKAIWNILTQAGLKSNVINWFASHPAEPIWGSVVTDRYATSAVLASGTSPNSMEGMFHPPALQDSLVPLAVSPRDIELDALLPFVPRAAEIDQDADDRLVKLASILARTSTVHAAACRLVAGDDWDFTAVYYSAIDEFGHTFMPYHPPHIPGVSEHDARIYGACLEGCYRFHDMMLESLLAYAGPETTVLIVSDHGFHSDVRRPGADAWEQPESWHREFGIACAHGPGVRKAQTLYGATLLDVTPTILAMLGLPLGRDMDGRPWLEIFEEPLAAQYIESWETAPGDAGMHGEELREDPAGAAEVVRRLIDLGYVDAPSGDVEDTIRKVARDRKINLAVSVTSSRRASDALDLWQELRTEFPDEPGFQIQLASCYMRLGRWAECHDAIELLPRSAGHSPFVQIMRAAVAIAEARTADGLSIARHIAKGSPTDPGVLNQLGDLFIKAGAWSEADAAFRRSLMLMEENPIALVGVARVALQHKQFDSALENALIAVGFTHFFPAAHFHLAEALEGLGRETEAIAAYESSLAMGYEPAITHDRLSGLYRLRNPRRAKRHRELALSN
jgi:predicted AlkP superfamily phosphohydrolase/phosphomutase/tetratricopeptide (TPR) repeat protein